MGERKARDKHQRQGLMAAGPALLLLLRLNVTSQCQPACSGWHVVSSSRAFPVPAAALPALASQLLLGPFPTLPVGPTTRLKPWGRQLWPGWHHCPAAQAPAIGAGPAGGCAGTAALPAAAEQTSSAASIGRQPLAAAGRHHVHHAARPPSALPLKSQQELLALVQVVQRQTLQQAPNACRYYCTADAGGWRRPAERATQGHNAEPFLLSPAGCALCMGPECGGE